MCISRTRLVPVVVLGLLTTGCEGAKTRGPTHLQPENLSRVQRIVSTRMPSDQVQAVIDRGRSAVFSDRLAVPGPDAPRVHDTGFGAIIATLPRKVNGREVMGASHHVIFNRSRQPVAVSGRPTDVPRPAPHQLDASQAVSSVLARHGVRLAPHRFRLIGIDGLYQHFDVEMSEAKLDGPIRVKSVYWDDGRTLHPAYYVEYSLTVARAHHALGVVVSAEDARVLTQNSKRDDAEPFGYRVWADSNTFEPESTPFCGDGIPHPNGDVAGYRPVVSCPMSFVEPPADGVSGPWLADDATETSGNNVDAFFDNCYDSQGEFYSDVAFNAAHGDFRALTTGLRSFDYSYDVSLAPEECFGREGPNTCASNDPQLNAKVVQTFYTANYLHDLMYRHGFDEASGNAQATNYGRGGMGGDALLVGAGGCTTYVVTKADGQSPGMRIGLNFSSGLSRGSTYDLWLLGHEWMHYMQRRLVGDTNGLNNQQGRALGEGWSDFFGLLLILRPEHAEALVNSDWQALYPGGAYFNEGYCDPVTQTCVEETTDPAYYFGIRRYPFTTDFAKSPLTFRHIENDVPLPESIPRFVWKGRLDNAEGHNAGEIWALALWHSLVEMMKDGRSVAEAKDRMYAYLVASMKVTPWDPTFTEARDALLTVVQASDPVDYVAFKRGFAARGMGAGAVSPLRDSYDFRGVTESFAADGAALSFIDARFEVSDATEDGDGLWDVDESATLVVHLRNTGFEDLNATRVTVSAPGVTFTDGAERAGLVSAFGEDLEVTFLLRLDASETYEDKAFTVTFEDDAAGSLAQVVSVRVRTHYDLLRTARTDTGAVYTTRDWTFDDDFTTRGGYTARAVRWTKIEDGDGGYRAPPGLGRYVIQMMSPWLKVSSEDDFRMQFRHAFDFLDAADDSYGLGFVQLRVAGDSPDSLGGIIGGPYNSRSLGYPSLNSEVLDLGRAYAGEVVQVSFVAQFETSFEDIDNGWMVDDIGFDGIDNTPFSEVHPQGALPGGNRPPEPDFEVTGDEMNLTFSDTSVDDGQIVSRQWHLGDGTIAVTPEVEHSYTEPRVQNVVLAVEDEQGAVSVVGQEVTPRYPLTFDTVYGGPFSDENHFFVDVPANVTSLTIQARGNEGWLSVYGRFDAPPQLSPYLADLAESKFFAADSEPTEVLRIDVNSLQTSRLYLQTLGSATELVVQMASDPVPDPDNPGLPVSEEGGCGCQEIHPSSGVPWEGGMVGLIAMVWMERRRRRSKPDILRF